MELTDIFEFISPTAIRIKGTRIDIEFVIEEFLFGSNPKRIRRRHPHLTPLQIYGSITYYLLNQERMDAYIETGRAVERAVIEKYRSNPSCPSSPNVGSKYLKSSADGSEKAVLRESVAEMEQVSAEGRTGTESGNLNIRDLFEFISPDAIRIKGTRVGIEIVIERCLDGENPEEIRRHHPHLTPLQIYGSITYYLLNKEVLDAYLKAGWEQAEAAYQEQLKNPSPGVARLMKIAAEAKTARLRLRELSYYTPRC